MTELTIKDVLGILRKWLALIIIAPIVISVAAGIYYYYFAQNEYTAKVKLYVLVDYKDSTGAVRYDMSTGMQFAGDYKQLITTHEVLNKVSQMLERPELEKEIDISVEAVTNTRVIEVNVTSKYPALSMIAANTIANVFVDYMYDITKTDSVSVASVATLPEIPSGPARARNTAIAYLAGLMLCMGVAFAVEMLNTTIKTDEEVETALEVPVLARIHGYRKEMENYLLKKGDVKTSLLRSVSPETQEGIRTLLMNLKFATMDRHMRAMAVTSTTPAEGKSSLTIMLATLLADEGKNVLLIDMDLRNPSLGKYLGVRNRNDLIDYVYEKASLDDVIRLTPINNVWLVDSYHRRAIASNVIQTEAFADFMEQVKDRYDFVILDTPPLGMFVDAALLTSSVDGVLMVLASGRVERKFAKEVVDQLHKANANLLGVALNFVTYRSGSAYGSGYYRYSRYYRNYRNEDYE